MQFILVHGAYGSPEGNWFPELQEKLEALGQHVLIPRFPTPEGQNLTNWIKVYEDAVKTLDPNEKLCLIGHSLGPLFILHIVEYCQLQLDSAIFVSPFMSKLNNPQFDSINNSFYKDDFDFGKLKKLIPVSYVLYSNNDPYVPASYSTTFADKLGSEKIVVKGGKHLNSEAGFTTFPLVLNLCKKLIGD